MATTAKAFVVDYVQCRRSERFPFRVTLMVCGSSPRFKEETVTISINSHGALLMLSAKVIPGQKLLLMNPETWDEREARVSRVGKLRNQRTEVAIEFTEPAPEFWAIGGLRGAHLCAARPGTPLAGAAKR